VITRFVVHSRGPHAIAGFTIRGALGRGAFGDVWDAVRTSDGSPVALKVLRANTDDDTRRRFAREARAAARVDSPYVCRMLEAHTAGEGEPYIAYERLEGETLDARLDREGDLSLDDALAMTLDALDALEAAHGAGVIHRDVKPANLFLEAPTSVDAESPRSFLRARLLDFGVAKLAGDDASLPLQTTHGSTLGSLAYMAPEQVGSSAGADPRADLYGLGAVVFRSLAGRPPFSAGSPAVMLALKLERDAPSLGSVTGVAWPAAVEAWLSKILERDPKQRFASAAAAREALEHVMERVGSAGGDR
jgi:serine/threonine-protein kinase